MAYPQYRGQTDKVLNTGRIPYVGDGTNFYPQSGNSSGHSNVVIQTGTSSIGKTGHDITGIGHGVRTVTTAGTDVALAASTTAKIVIVQSQTDNTGLIAVGGSGVDATEATGTGIILYAGDTVTLPVDNLADVYIDATVSGEGVRYTYFT